MLPRYKQLHETKSQPVFLREKQNSVMTVLMKKHPSWAVHFENSDYNTDVVQKLIRFLPLAISVHAKALHPGSKLS